MSRSGLYALLALLLVVKFLLLPLVSWQHSKQVEIESSVRRFERATALLRDRARLERSVQVVRSALDKMHARVPSGATVDQVKLASQQKIKATLASAGVNLGVFDWLAESSSDQFGLAFITARMQIQGSIRTVAAAHAALEGGFPNIVVRSIQMGASGPVGAPGEVPATMTITADFYFRLEKAANQ